MLKPMFSIPRSDRATRFLLFFSPSPNYAAHAARRHSPPIRALSPYLVVNTVWHVEILSLGSFEQWLAQYLDKPA